MQARSLLFRSTLTALASIACVSFTRAEPLFSDPFTADAKVPERRALRGDWRIADGVAQCAQDDALYKKHQDHGPIIFYDLATTDATFRYAFRPEGCRSVVFTLNNAEGHVFRFVTSGERGTNFRAFPPSDDHKSIATHRADDWNLVDGEWTEVTVALKGDTATVKFGDHEPVTVRHETHGKEKTNFSVGFSFGSLAIRGIEVSR